MVTFNTETLCYQAISRVLCDKQDGELYGLSFNEVFKQATKVNANFNHGKSLRQIVVDFHDAEHNGFTRVLGKDITEKLLRGCSVHWKRSVNIVAKLVCLSRDEETIFKTLAGKVEDASSRDAEEWEETSDMTNPVESINRQSFKSRNNLNVILENIYLEHRIHAVKMVARSRNVNISYSVDSQKRKNGKTVHWKRSVNKVAKLVCLSRDEETIFKTLAGKVEDASSRDAEEWEETSDMTNPVESINRQSFKSRNNLNVILENIYLEHRIHAVKMVARSRNVNISYLVDSQKRKNGKRKRTSLVANAETSKQDNANGPPDKAKDIKTAKRARRRGKGLINSMVEVEYKEKNEDGELCYLGWLKGTITAYNSRQGYLVQFQNQKDCNGNETGDWTDWLPSVNCSDVRISK